MKIIKSKNGFVAFFLWFGEQIIKTKNLFVVSSCDLLSRSLEEIENIDIASLTNGHDLFECNLCSFESGLGDSIREHMIDHVNPQIHDESASAADVVKAPYQSLLDEYDEDGNYIGNNPKYMD